MGGSFNQSDDDEDLEAELNALTFGNGAAGKRLPKGTLPINR